MTQIIEIKDLVKQYPGAPEPSVRGLSFGVLQGEVFSLLGPNGAGKTTTLSVLSCLLPPSGGEALVAGHSVRTAPQAVKRALGVVPQEVALYPTLSARENLRFWGQMYGLGGAELQRRVEDVLEAVGLRDRANDRVDKYSGGMKRRINSAAGLLHRPQVVLMDEPTVGIDPQSRRSILDMVKALNAQGMTVLYTTHYMEEAQELSHRIAIVDHGRLMALGTLAELTRLVGEDDEVELRLDAEAAAAPAALLAALAEVAGVRQLDALDHTVRLMVQDGNAALPGLISEANRLGVRVTNVSIKEPNLEAVFLHLTGRALRD
jgi:ABC-2 type transport system ATP-binding protein